MKDKLTHCQKDLVLEALHHYRDNQIKDEGRKKRIMNQATDKIIRLL